MVEGREIVIGVTGGIAAYKTATLVSSLAQAGARVTVVMTEAARQFVGESTFEALTGRPVLTKTFHDDAHPLGAHISLAEQGELLCVAPATANFIAKMAHGLADDLLNTLVLSFTGPVIVAPAMNCEMWEKPAVARNVETLRTDGITIVDPEEGWLSCRRRGVGRMAAPETIQQCITSLLAPPSKSC